jgi:hypothetical protein
MMAYPRRPHARIVEITMNEEDTHSIDVTAYSYFYSLVTMEIMRKQLTNVATAEGMHSPSSSRVRRSLVRSQSLWCEGFHSRPSPACSRIPPFSKYAVIPGHTESWQPIGALMPAAFARRRIMRQVSGLAHRLLGSTGAFQALTVRNSHCLLPGRSKPTIVEVLLQNLIRSTSSSEISSFVDHKAS